MGEKMRTYTKKELGGYLVGMFGQNVIYNIVATGLYFYFQNVICLPAMALGWIFALARVWDAINDPMMGTIVDRTRTKWGKCRPYLIIFPAIICVITILCFLNKNYAEATTQSQKVMIVAWAAVSYIAWGMCYTVGDIPLWGITSLMTEDEDDRSKILSLARIVAGVAGISILCVQVAQIVADIFVKKGYPYIKAQQYGFIATAIVMTVIASICFEFAGIFTKERVEQSEKKYGFIENFKIMFKNKPFRQILISGILRSPIQLLMIVAMTLVTYYFANGDFMNLVVTDLDDKIVEIKWNIIIRLAIIAVGIFVGQFVAMAITPMLTKRVEKKTLYNIASIGGAVPFALIYVFYKISGGELRGNIIWAILVGIAFLFASAAMGCINVLQSIMIADCVDYEEYHNGVRTDGVFFSGQSFITKLSAGIASFISAGVYAAVGYSDVNIAKMNEALKNGADFVTYDGGSGAGKYAATMFFLVAVPPAIGMLLSAIPTLKYAMTDKDHSRILSELVAKRAAADIDNKNEDVADADAEVLAENMEDIVSEINSIE